jgi:hypothetical protein
MFITNEAARNDLACQMAMASYMKQLQAEEQRRQEIRQGLRPAPTWSEGGTWNISDRH